MKFRYQKIPSPDPKQKWLKRPIIDIRVLGPQGGTTVSALVDSGADHSLFHIDIAKDIGIDLNKSNIAYFRGIEGGRMPTFLERVKIQIIGSDKTTELLAGFTDSRTVSAILGQEGFFDEYRIKFERDHNLIEITPIRD